MNDMQPSGLIRYKDYRYLKVFCILVGVSVMAYSIEPVGSDRYGGTWLGYVLGILSGLLVLLLMWYGIAKRRTPRAPNRRQYKKSERRKLGDVAEGENAKAETGGDAKSQVRKGADRRARHARETLRYGGTLQGWLSAHIYLGASLCVLATLHTGFQFGWNVHTLAYGLMLLVVVSGIYGVYVYVNYPRLITLNMGGDLMGDVLLRIAELDELARSRALGLPAEINALVLRASSGTRLGGSFWQQLNGYQRHCPTRLAAQEVLRLGSKYISDEQPKLMRDLYSVLLRKEKLVLKARREIMLTARMQIWLYIHVPLSIGLLAALIAHVVAILFYW